jgi:hypothetical protein
MPTDQWKFISPQEEYQEGESAEESAIHLESGWRVHERTPEGADAARRFSDEEADDPVEEARRDAADEEQDLEAMLEIQHYSFAPESDE